MLNNHLTSIQKNYKVLGALIYVSALCSCANINAVKKENATTTQSHSGSYCERTQSESADERSLIFAAKNKSNGIINCFRSYLRFEEKKRQLIKTCTRLEVNRSGRVTYTKVLGVSPRIVPKDLQMCLEQEYWKMEFHGLQLDRSYSLKFPLNLSSL